MSLTDELEDKDSAIGRYVEDTASTVSYAKRGHPLADELKKLIGLDNLPKQVLVPPVAGANPGTVGMAFDYRLRYHMAPCTSTSFNAASRGGLELGSNGGRAAVEHVHRFFANLDKLSAELTPAGRHLADEDEALLARYCVLLALMEAIYRAGPIAMFDLPPPARAREDPRNEPLLALAPEPAVRDVLNLSRSAEQTFAPHIALAAAGEVTYEANPAFAGSILIHADADLLLDDCLFEVKTTKLLDGGKMRKALLQLVGYALLDYDDQYAMRKVGVYFVRYGWVVTWPLWQFIFPPADVIRWRLHESAPSEIEIAGRLAERRQGMQRVVLETDLPDGDDLPMQ